MSDRIDVTFTCLSCGARSAVLELPDNPTDYDIAKCKSCGVEVGRYGDIKAEAVRRVNAEVTSKLRKAFKGVKGWKIK
jgi:transcription elongation factor Elf1